MSVHVIVKLTEREADALLKVEKRSGWNPAPSMALQRADFKIVAAIQAARSSADSGEAGR